MPSPYPAIAHRIRSWFAGGDPLPAEVAAGALALIAPRTGAIGAAVAACGGSASTLFFPLDTARQLQLLPDDGAITIKSGTAFLARTADAGVYTIAAPLAGLPADGGDDGKRLTLQSLTAQAHTVTTVAPGFAGDAVALTATFSGAVADGITLLAYGGVWYPTGTPRGVTVGDSAPRGLTVSGFATTAVNGVYTEDGTANGHPRFVSESGAYLQWLTGLLAWVIYTPDDTQQYYGDVFMAEWPWDVPTEFWQLVSGSLPIGSVVEGEP